MRGSLHSPHQRARGRRRPGVESGGRVWGVSIAKKLAVDTRGLNSPAAAAVHVTCACAGSRAFCLHLRGGAPCYCCRATLQLHRLLTPPRAILARVVCCTRLWSEPCRSARYRGETRPQERLPGRGRYGHMASAKVSYPPLAPRSFKTHRSPPST